MFGNQLLFRYKEYPNIMIRRFGFYFFYFIFFALSNFFYSIPTVGNKCTKDGASSEPVSHHDCWARSETDRSSTGRGKCKVRGQGRFRCERRFLRFPGTGERPILIEQHSGNNHGHRSGLRKGERMKRGSQVKFLTFWNFWEGKRMKRGSCLKKLTFWNTYVVLEKEKDWREVLVLNYWLFGTQNNTLLLIRDFLQFYV